MEVSVKFRVSDISQIEAKNLCDKQHKQTPFFHEFCGVSLAVGTEVPVYHEGRSAAEPSWH